MELDEHKARIILDLTHAAWSRGDVEGVLAQYVDDLTWFCNAGGPDGGPLTVVGKQGLRDMLQPIADVAESVSVSEFPFCRRRRPRQNRVLHPPQDDATLDGRLIPAARHLSRRQD